jgi:hypothetical protein
MHVPVAIYHIHEFLRRKNNLLDKVLSDERELVSVCGSAVTIYAAESRCHSTSAASRLPLKSSREMRCLSWLK